MLKVDIFPARWKDLSMHCSCPDWAVPCKHLAAVIYLISREIDGNPFMVFALKGVDLAQELKTRHIAIEREAEAALPTVDALLYPPHQDATSARDNPGQEDYTALDYSILPNLTASLLSVLPANPTFFQHGDFRNTYEKVMKRVIRNARRALEVATEAGDAMPAIAPADKPRILLDSEYQPMLAGLTTLEHWPDLISALQQLTEADLPDLQPEAAAMFHVRMASLHLLAQGAVLPQVFDAGKSGVGVRWLPAMLDETSPMSSYSLSMTGCTLVTGDAG